MELPVIPNNGDYITISQEGEKGTSDFIVKRKWWRLNYSDSSERGSFKSLFVECEFAIGPYSNERHKKTCETYKKTPGRSLEFDDSMY